MLQQWNKTNGCHAGAYPYIGFEYDETTEKKLANVIKEALSEKGSQLLLKPDGGNPLSGPDWYKPNIGIQFDAKYKEEADQIFERLKNKIEEKQEPNEDLKQLMKLNSFLVGKYSNVYIRLQHNQKDEYVFSIEKAIYEDDRTYPKLNALLTGAGLELFKEDEIHKDWMIRDEDFAKIAKQINESSNYIINNYDIEKPKSIEEEHSLIIKAHIKRDECMQKGNMAEFELWLMQESEKMDREIEKSNQEEKKKAETDTSNKEMSS